MKLDILVFAVHPDDAELACSGTIMSQVAMGRKVGIVDLTQGELGTRGTAALRLQEAQEASKILGLAARENLGMADGFFLNDTDSKLRLIRAIRKYRPELVLSNAVNDRHPDHSRASKLAEEACFLSGLPKVETDLDGQEQEAWRPKQHFHYIQDYHAKPDFVVDITPFFEKKLESVMAFKSQFFNENSDEPETPISSKSFIDFLEARAREMGRPIGAEFAEGFTHTRPFGVHDILDLR